MGHSGPVAERATVSPRPATRYSAALLGGGLQRSRQYHFEFDHPVERLWAVVSDTPRWGEASGLPRYKVREELQGDGTVKLFGETRIGHFELAWEELPGDWVAERWFRQKRVFSRGPIASMTTRATLEDRGARSAVTFELVFDCNNLLGSLLAKRMLKAYAGQVRELLDTASRLIAAEQPTLFASHYEPPPGQLERARKLVAALRDSPYEHGLGATLLEHINDTQEIDLWSMRPLAIARRWRRPEQEVIELFLQAVRAGLLESRWDILCPRCRISKSSTSNMSELPRGVHCDACNIDFESDFASNVELCFSPSPAVRPVEYGLFCRSGPGVTPHIKAQCALPPGERRSVPLVLAPGEYRVRTLEAGGEVELDWRGGAFPPIRVSGGEVTLGDASTAGEIAMRNDGDVPRTVVIEDRSWLADVLTAARVTTLQAFRDLFSEQVLRPGDEVSIRNITFMFTDLEGSSSLFATMGDAEAYHLVREHFAMLGEIVRRHHGNIVKTVGDGVHAAFLTPDDALRAAVEIQRSMPEFNRRHGHQIAIRIGLHSGSSISVTLNDRLDYYGDAVNLAARLEGQGKAGQITMSADFAADPEVGAILEQFDPRQHEIDIKGYDEPLSVTQIRPAA